MVSQRSLLCFWRLTLGKTLIKTAWHRDTPRVKNVKGAGSLNPSASTSIPSNTNAPVWSMSIEIHGKFLLGRLLLSLTEPKQNCVFSFFFFFFCLNAEALLRYFLIVYTGCPNPLLSTSFLWEPIICSCLAFLGISLTPTDFHIFMLH